MCLVLCNLFFLCWCVFLCVCLSVLGLICAPPPLPKNVINSMNMAKATRSYRLNRQELQYLRTLIDETVETVHLRDINQCAEFVLHAIKGRKMTASMLRPHVIDTIVTKGLRQLKPMLYRHAAFINQPLPLRGKALHKKATEIGLVHRTKIVRVDSLTIRNELNMVEGRKKMKNTEDIGRDCKRVVMLQTKRKDCVQSIVAQATATGVADTTRVWRDFQSEPKLMVKVCLKAIAAVATLKHVYVLDIHELTCLFHFPTFQKVLELLTHSHIFAINMGEDEGIFNCQHFDLLACKILNGTSAVRRWFVESHPTRRKILVECGLVPNNVRTDRPNVFTVARQKDLQLWDEGDRNSSRLAWLLAPASAFTGATQFKTDMQNSTCNWQKACAARQVGIASAMHVNETQDEAVHSSN